MPGAATTHSDLAISDVNGYIYMSVMGTNSIHRANIRGPGDTLTWTVDCGPGDTLTCPSLSSCCKPHGCW